MPWPEFAACWMAGAAWLWPRAHDFGHGFRSGEIVRSRTRSNHVERLQSRCS